MEIVILSGKPTNCYQILRQVKSCLTGISVILGWVTGYRNFTLIFPVNFRIFQYMCSNYEESGKAWSYIASYQRYLV